MKIGNGEHPLIKTLLDDRFQFVWSHQRCKVEDSSKGCRERNSVISKEDVAVQQVDARVEHDPSASTRVTMRHHDVGRLESCQFAKPPQLARSRMRNHARRPAHQRDETLFSGRPGRRVDIDPFACDQELTPIQKSPDLVRRETLNARATVVSPPRGATTSTQPNRAKPPSSLQRHH